MKHQRLRWGCYVPWRYLDGRVWLGMAPDFFGGSHRVEHTFHDLLGACTIRGVGSLRLEQFRVRQDDPELVIELMEQQAQLCVYVLSVRLDMVC